MRNSVLEPHSWTGTLRGATVIRWMKAADLSSVLQIERRCYPTPWTEASFRFEIERQPHAILLVLTVEDIVYAYCCAWFTAGELQINNIAVHPEVARRGYATALLSELLRRVYEAGGIRATLEVRESNSAALRLYASLGFRTHARRPDFYIRPPESALILECILDSQLQEYSMPSAVELRERLLASDPHFQSLHRRHCEYEEQLASFHGRHWLSPEDQVEVVTIKKKKLAVKDEMERILVEG